jgi:hypothetical protein
MIRIRYSDLKSKLYEFCFMPLNSEKRRVKDCKEEKDTRFAHDLNVCSGRAAKEFAINDDRAYVVSIVIQTECCTEIGTEYTGR